MAKLYNILILIPVITITNSLSPPLLETVARRACVIKRLLEEPADKRELEATLDVSRTTVNRAIDNLDDAECIIYQDGKWCVTLIGKLAYSEYEQLSTKYNQLTTAQSLLSHLPSKSPLNIQVIADSVVTSVKPPAPDAPLTQLENLLQNSDQIKGLSPVVCSQYVSLFHHHIVEQGTDTELVLSGELVDYLWTNYKEKMSAVLKSDDGMVWRFEEKLMFGFILIDEKIVWVAIYDEDGRLKGSLVNDTNAGVSWATKVFQSYRQQAEQVSPHDGTPTSLN